MNRKFLIVLAIAVIIAAAAVIMLLGTPSPLSHAGTPDPVTLGMYASEGSSLMYIAEDQGYFSDNGLAVTIRTYDPPSIGIRAVADGRLDIAAATEYPVVMNVLNGGNFSIIARYDEINTTYLIGRKDREIGNISDLRGKRIGVPRGTIAEFNLGRFLTLHGMELADVTVVPVQPPQFIDAIESGQIDAIICWQPPASEITGRMGDRVVVWPAQSGQPAYGVLVMQNGLAARNPSLVARFLKSLDRAEDYIVSHPVESRAIVQRRANLSDEYMAVMWPANQFGLSLDQSLVLAMEDEARWMIANKLTNATRVPDFSDYMYPDALEKIRPGSVNIIR